MSARRRTAPRTSATPALGGSGASDYERYLRTDELLALQKTPAEWAHRDELLFTAVHQTSELWLKFAAGEVEEAARADGVGRAVGRDPPAAPGGASRSSTSPPRSRCSSRCRPGNTRRSASCSATAAALTRRASARSLTSRDAPGARSGGSVADAGLELVELYQRGREFEALYQAAEALTDWDERIFVWRFRHYATVARSIGEDTTGTQGTPVAVLGKLIAQRQLPELWKARATLVERFDAAETSLRTRAIRRREDTEGERERRA